MCNKKVRILIMIDSLKFGGAEKQAVTDANILANAKFAVDFVYFIDGPLKQQIHSAINVIHISRNSYIGKIFCLISILRQNHINIIHSHMFMAELVSAFAGWVTGTKVLFNEHGLGLWRRWYHVKAFWLAALFADRIICASDAASKVRNLREGIPKCKLESVYNCYRFPLNISNGKGKLLRDEISSSLNVAGKEYVFVGYVGRFDPVKRLSLFIELARHMTENNVIFVLVGDGRERQEIERMISEHGLNHKFYLPGFIDNTNKYYNLFDIFVLPSKRESLSVSLLEAGGCGVPAVAFDVGGNSEVISHGETGFIIPENDVEGFVEKVRELVTNKELRQRFGKAAILKISARFSEERRLSNLISIYNEACNKRT